jgi:hypothetical protein
VWNLFTFVNKELLLSFGLSVIFPAETAAAFSMETVVHLSPDSGCFMLITHLEVTPPSYFAT